jgi:hypothetical protein
MIVGPRPPSITGRRSLQAKLHASNHREQHRQQYQTTTSQTERYIARLGATTDIEDLDL